MSNQAECEQSEYDVQFRELMAHLHQVFWKKNAADDAVLFISPAYETISGRPCQSLFDDFQTFLNAVHPEDRQRVARAMAGQRESGGYEEEYRILRPDGAIRWIWARSYPVRDGQGRIVRFAGIAEDITERKSLEQDRARLAAIVEYSEDAIVSMSVDCIITSWNRGAERQYGYTAEEIVGCSLSVLFPPDRYQEYLRTLENVRQGEPVASCDTVRRRKDGTLVNTSVSIFPIEVRDHAIVGASKISRDLTAIKKLEKQFIAAQKMEVVSQVAAGMAHDFNNLLAVIMGCTDLIMEGLSEDAPIHKDVETIRQAAERAAGLTQQLLVFSRKVRATPIVLDLNEVVRSWDRMLRQLVDENIDLSLVRGEQLGRIKADSGHIGQVLLNLVINARDAMPDGGRLSITTSNVTLDGNDARSINGVTSGKYVLLSVSDTGTGIADEVKSRLFEPFFTTKPQGTGLGLATCDTIVKLCHGHISVRSELGAGSTFDLYFPAVSEPLDNSLQPPRSRGIMPRGTETVLVVESERAVRNLTCSVLESLGYTVLAASSDQLGLRMAREREGQPIRLVITDAGMATMRGDVLAEWQKMPWPERKFLFTSGNVDDVVSNHGVPAVGSAFLTKPYTLAQLAYTVRTLLDR